MENLISLVNRLQRACTALGDHGDETALPTLWDALPSIAVVGGQVWVFAFTSPFSSSFSFLIKLVIIISIIIFVLICAEIRLLDFKFVYSLFL